jgi:Tol biopolymer transport system component
MSNPKHSTVAFLISLALLLSLSAYSCARPAVNTQPSGLTSLLAFSSDRDATVHVYTVRPDGTDIKSTSSDSQILDGLPSWSSDGARILFNSSQSGDFEVWSMSADGSDRKKLTDMKGWDGLARMSPDGKQIVFIGQRATAEKNTNTNILLMNSDGTGIVQLTGTTDTAISGDSKKGSWSSVPTWSPDGAKILFGTTREGNGITPVFYTMNTDGGDQQRFGFIFPTEGTEPDWSPVTNKIVFVKGSEAKGDIWVMDAGFPFPGLTARKLTDNFDNNRSPVWSPDGKQIAFISDTNGNNDIFIMNADGTNVRRLTYDESNEFHPSWR